MATTVVNPPSLAKPRGYSHGATGTGRVLFISGQVGADSEGKMVSDDIVEQFDQALGNLVCVLREAGGSVEDIVKINLLILNKGEYREKGRDIGRAYRKHLAHHYPAMTLAEVKGLFDDESKVEIEAVAVLP